MMPSLLKYFTIVGGLLLAGLIGMNALLDPSGPGPSLVKAEAPKSMQFDPRASKVERLRAEEAAKKAAVSSAPVAVAAVAAQSAPVLQAAARVAPEQPAAAPEQPAAAPEQPAAAPEQPAAAPAPSVRATASVAPGEPPQILAPAALTRAPQEGEAARAKRIAREQIKAEKIAGAKARKQRLARERPRYRAPQEASAQYARQVPQYQYSYAPRPSYGPFAQGDGWGGGWGRGW